MPHAAADPEHPAIPPDPPATDPEHGDLTPVFVQWYADNHSKAEFHTKYASRLGLIPAGIREAVLEGGAA
jgi:hypothetical protein